MDAAAAPSASASASSAKKRKADENGNSYPASDQPQPQTLTPPLPSSDSQTTLSLDDSRKLLEPFSHDQLLSLLQTAVIRHPDVLSSARSLADSDVTRRKLFVRGLGPETTTDALKSIFSSFGELDEAVVISDKGTSKSKGYGFVTFKHVDGALLALRQPSKRIDGRMTVTHLASTGRGPNSDDQATRKVYVGNVPYGISAERLLDFFAAFGEIEEGPLGFDKQGGKARGFAFFIYKTEEGARMALMEPTKVIDGHQVMCKLAEDGKKGKVGGNPVLPNVGGEMGGDRMGGSGNHPYIGPLGNFPTYTLPPAPSQLGPPPPPGYHPSQGTYLGGPLGLYGGSSGGEYGSYRMPPPPSSTGAPPPYQEGSGGGYGSSGGSYTSQSHHPPQGPPQGPPSGMYRLPPAYY